MTNRYPLWKNLLILIVVLCGFYYAAPNLYAPDPALQIAGASSAQQIDERVLARAEAAALSVKSCKIRVNQPCCVSMIASNSCERRPFWRESWATALSSR